MNHIKLGCNFLDTYQPLIFLTLGHNKLGFPQGFYFVDLKIHNVLDIIPIQVYAYKTNKGGMFLCIFGISVLNILMLKLVKYILRILGDTQAITI